MLVCARAHVREGGEAMVLLFEDGMIRLNYVMPSLFSATLERRGESVRHSESDDIVRICSSAVKMVSCASFRLPVCLLQVWM